MTSQITECVFGVAEAALLTGDIQICANCDLVAVPDVIILQGQANGEEIWITRRLRRPDGREVWLYDADEVCIDDWIYQLWGVGQ